MGDFFKPWRRKIGPVFLCPTIVFACGWARSFVYVDVMDYMNQHSLVRAESFEQTVVLSIGRSDETFRRSVRADSVKFASHDEAILSSILILFEPQLEENNCFFVARESHAKRWCGFCWGTVEMSSSYRDIWKIPYWSIVIPLTMISGYFVLSKPRLAKPKATIENGRSE